MCSNVLSYASYSCRNQFIKYFSWSILWPVIRLTPDRYFSDEMWLCLLTRVRNIALPPNCTKANLTGYMNDTPEQYRLRLNYFSLPTPQNKRLTTLDSRRFIAYHSSCMPISRIAIALSRSRSIFRSFLRCETKYDRRNPDGKPPRRLQADKRKIIPKLSGEYVRFSDNLKSLQLNQSHGIVHRVFYEFPYL